jgi:hypothetical protein
MNSLFTRRAVRWLAIAAVVSSMAPAGADDRDLLKFRGAKPYLFILLDSSGSMNLKIGADDIPAEGHADDPASRLWGAKEALYSVFHDVEDVQFGFAAMNHDSLRVENEHWLYYLTALPSTWPIKTPSASISWPLIDADGLTTDLVTEDTDGDGTADAVDGIPDADVEGDAMVFGTTFTDSSGSPLVAGTCLSPLQLDDDTGRRQVNAFAKLGSTGTTMTTIWFQFGKGGSKQVYRLEIVRPVTRPDGSANASIGEDNLAVQFKLAGNVSNCNSIPASVTYDFEFRLDANLNRFVMIDRGVDGVTGGNNPSEQTAALWAWSDANDTAYCGSSHPFSGKGWEGNYDSGVEPPEAPNGNPLENVDRYCYDGDGDGTSTCIEMKPADETVLSSYGRPLDRGDVLPFDWSDAGNNRDLMMQRLAPNWPEESPHFGVSYHLSTALDGDAEVFEPRLVGRPPILARGDTPLAKAINDVRCWYMGGKADNQGKCGESAYFADDGWTTVACGNDPDYGCRRPFLVVISDGDDVCKGEDATADISDMKSHTGMKTWALNVGDPRGCASGGGLHSLVQAAKGECVNVSSKEDLKDILEDILGEIREQARSFATAAVPSVQTTSDQAIFVSSFTPLNEKSIWDGHLNAFLKPMPVDQNGSPDTGISCGSGVTAGCHLWDAGTAIESQYDSADPLGSSVSQRRVSYSLFQTGGAVPRATRLFDPIDCSASPPSLDCTDLLDGLGVPYTTSSTASMLSAKNEANQVITTALSLKSHVLTNIDGTSGATIQFLLGDLFHSNPVVIGSPVNVPFWVGDLYSDGTECTDDETGNPGYRCYFARHRFRRKVLLAGANDGMLHAFEAGRFRENGTDPITGRTLDHQFNNGTGHELFAYIPRATLPTVRTQAQGNEHQYGVDGTPVAADVFIDAAHDGTPVPGERRWRTVVVGGLREGGTGYYALDLTQPDRIKMSDELGAPIPDDNGASNWVPSCMTSYSASECGPNAYPAVLWEWSDTTDDSHLVSPLALALAMDEDRNGVSDLGTGWSTANIGRIRVCSYGGTHCEANVIDDDDGTDVVDMFVAIIGGGLDPDAVDKTLPSRGNWLYMLDIETGKVIYKRELCSPYSQVSCINPGSVAAEPAAVDTNLDGYYDRIYVVTTGGFAFRVDLGASDAGNLPALTQQTVAAIDPDTGAPFDLDALRVQRLDASSGELLWEPVAMFDANWDVDPITGTPTATAIRRPLYQRPTVFFAALLDRFGVAFGSGNREDLWTKVSQEARFYLFIDDVDDIDPAVLPLTEAALLRIGVEDDDINQDLLQIRAEGQKGWYIPLDEEERVITDAFALSGVTIFSSFQPAVAITESDCDPSDPSCDQLDTIECGDKQFEKDTDNLCAHAGISRNFVVGTTNGDAFLFDSLGNSTRYETVSTFVTSPFSEPGQNKNPDNIGDESNADALSDVEVDIMDHLKKLFPENCRFANYRVDIKTIAADTRVERIAPIPICLVEKNWKEY